MDATQVIDAVRVLLVVGMLSVGALLLLLRHGDDEDGWRRRYLEEHPGLRNDFEVWRTRRQREMALERGRCPKHDVQLDVGGLCSYCRGRPSG